MATLLQGSRLPTLPQGLATVHVRIAPAPESTSEKAARPEPEPIPHVSAAPHDAAANRRTETRQRDNRVSPTGDSTSGEAFAEVLPPTAKPAEQANAVAVFDSAQYWPVTALDRYPTLRESVRDAMLSRLSALPSMSRAQLSLWIDEHGQVTKVEIIEAQPASELNDVVLDTYRDAVFVPGEREGIAVKSKLIVEIGVLENEPENAVVRE